MKYLIEIATTDFLTTRSAVEGGADRIELCSALSEGGITPSYGLIIHCKDSFDVPIFPIIRPRPGDFLYTDEEYEVMKRDVILSKQTGCNGVVLGMLDKDGNVDLMRIARLVELAHPLEVTFHRAFDRCRDPFEAMEQLVRAGCKRILTSGQKPVAAEGVDLIAQLVKAANNRITIMPGSGVRKENIKMIAEKTGAIEFHSSVKGEAKSAMEYIHPDVSDSVNPAIYPSAVNDLRSALE